MKKLLFIATLSVLLFSCKEKKEDKPATTTQVTMALPISYSSSFEMGDPAYAAMIVKGSWKDWVANDMDNMKSWVADTCVAFQANNMMTKGVDSLLAAWKKGRAAYSSCRDSIDAVMSVRSTDKNENWVLVWATAYDTKLDGSIDTSAVQETWRINKDGKADLLYQFDRAKRKQ